jgi:hypothetical protein
MPTNDSYTAGANEWIFDLSGDAYLRGTNVGQFEPEFTNVWWELPLPAQAFCMQGYKSVTFKVATDYINDSSPSTIYGPTVNIDYTYLGGNSRGLNIPNGSRGSATTTVPASGLDCGHSTELWIQVFTLSQRVGDVMSVDIHLRSITATFR